MTLAVIRSIDAPRRLSTLTEVEDFEQELVDQYALSMVGAGFVDDVVADHRRAVFDFAGFLGRPVWTAQPADADRYLKSLRKDRRLARATVQGGRGRLAQFFDFLLSRYQTDIHALTAVVVIQPIDEFNRPAKADYRAVRVPPSDDEVETLFAALAGVAALRPEVPARREGLSGGVAVAAGRVCGSPRRSCWTSAIGIPDLGEMGKLHVRFGKGSRGRGPKNRLVPGIASVDALLEWWLTDVRHQFGDDWSDPAAPLLPSERRDRLTGRCTRVGPEALRAGLAGASPAGCRRGRVD